MEQNLPIITKKLWKIAKITFFVLKKGISKKKIVQNLSLMIQRQKQYISTPYEYEFSCSNTPLYRHYFTNKRSKVHHKFDFEAKTKIHLDAINNMLDYTSVSEEQHIIQQLSITNSPFWVQNETECNEYVNEAADEFIRRFYSQLKEETC